MQNYATVPWVLPASTTTVSKKKVTGLVATDVVNLTQLLRTGEPGVQQGTFTYHPVRDSEGNLMWYNTYTRSGGYAFLVKSSKDGPFLLNLDHGDLVDHRVMAKFRKQLVELAAELGLTKSVLPVGLTALRNGPAHTLASRQSIEVVVVEGTEAVLKIDGNSYLSGYDSQEAPPLYFLCRLPHEVDSVADARDALMPESVKIALKEGRRVERQGDLFAIRSNMTDRDIEDAGGTIWDYEAFHGDHGSKRAGLALKGEYRLYGTIHTAKRLARLPSGMEMATGWLVHDPLLGEDRRNPDHQQRMLDDGWWFVIPNTVPKNSGAARRRVW